MLEGDPEYGHIFYMTPGIIPLIAGLAGTAVMTAFLLLPRWLKLGEVDVIRAVGSLITRRTDNAWLPGLIVHIASGIIWAYLYLFLLRLLTLPPGIVGFTFAGAIHGVIVMLLVSIVIMEHHPIARYHARGPMTGFMQLVAHVLYGFTVGVVWRLFHS